MAFAPVLNRHTWVGPTQLRTGLNTVSLESSFEVLDCTNDASGGAMEHAMGLESTTTTLSGMVVTSSAAFQAGVAAAPSQAPVVTALTAVATNPAAGDLVYGVKLTEPSSIAWGYPVGQLATLSIDRASSGPKIRGQTLGFATRTSTGTTNGTGVNFGAVASGETLHAILLRADDDVAGTAPTLDVPIESDASDAWIGAETTRFTFTQETDVTAGYQALSLAGPVTDTWWRVVDTVGGTSPVFTFWCLIFKTTDV